MLWNSQLDIIVALVRHFLFSYFLSVYTELQMQGLLLVTLHMLRGSAFDSSQKVALREGEFGGAEVGKDLENNQIHSLNVILAQRA